jgi:hypothetical protein
MPEVDAMDFIDILAQVRKLLQEHERVTYRVLKRQFTLDDESLEDLKEQLIEAEELAIDKDGKMLVWAGAGKNTRQQSSTAQSQPPISYTPQHLVERIRAEQAAMESRGRANGERKTITMWQSQPIKL